MLNLISPKARLTCGRIINLPSQQASPIEVFLLYLWSSLVLPSQQVEVVGLANNTLPLS